MAEAGVTWRLGDLDDGGFVRTLVRTARPDVVFHLASVVRGSRALELVVPTATTNLMATIHMLEAATEVGCDRLVLLGTGDHPGIDEPPCSPYAAAKWAAFGYARMFHALYGTPVTTARPFMVYGTGQHDLSKIVPHVITSLLRNEQPRLSGGRRRCDWIYIDDVVEGLLAVASVPACIDRMVDLGSGKLDSVRTVVELIRMLVPSDIEPLWGAHADRPGETEWAADLAATRALCDWEPTTDLADGLTQTIEWFRREAPWRP
jgi:nucleoside-diphosphate-sugar epimerase